MLMPLMSVTLIGLIVGLTAGASSGRVGRALLQGVVTAWAGFAAGAMAGMTVDVVAGAGSWLAWLGHAGAVVAAVVGFWAEPSRERARA